MRYLRVLSNSVIGAALASAYVLAVVLALNPTVPLTMDGIVRLVSTVGVYDTLNLTVLPACCSWRGSCFHTSCFRLGGSASASWCGSARGRQAPARF
jgi:hypothetical protein